MSRLPLIARLLLGLLFTVAGFLGLFAARPELSGNMAVLMDGFDASGYLFELVKVTETVCGLLLLTGFFVPLALVILAPVVVNIVAVNLFVSPAGLPLAALVLALEIYLAWIHRRAYAPLFEPSPKAG